MRDVPAIRRTGWIQWIWLSSRPSGLIICLCSIGYGLKSLRAWLAQILAVNRCSIDCVYTLNSINNFINTIFCSYSDFIFHSQITTETVFKKEYTTQSTSLTLLAINKHLATHRHYFITDETALESYIPMDTQSVRLQPRWRLCSCRNPWSSPAHHLPAAQSFTRALFVRGWVRDAPVLISSIREP